MLLTSKVGTSYLCCDDRSLNFLDSNQKSFLTLELGVYEP